MVDVLVILKEFSKTLNRENPVLCLQGINFTPSGPPKEWVVVAGCWQQLAVVPKHLGCWA